MKETVILLVLGLFAGAFSGILGIGGGIIVIPFLVMLLGYSQQMAQGTSLALLLPPIGLLAVINYHNAGFVNYKAAGLMVITFLIGSYLTSKYAVNLNEVYLKKGFAIFLILYALKILFDK
jgi:uncharacterized membrane protein YfcA